MMSNPQNFCKFVGIYYEHEGKESISTTGLTRLFEGNSAKGGINATVIDFVLFIVKNP